MNVNEVVQAISSLGFPIVTCLLCFWYINKTTEDLRNAIDNNTRVMTKIITKLNIDEGDDGK